MSTPLRNADMMSPFVVMRTMSHHSRWASNQRHSISGKGAQTTNIFPYQHLLKIVKVANTKQLGLRMYIITLGLHKNIYCFVEIQSLDFTSVSPNSLGLGGCLLEDFSSDTSI